MSNGNNRRKGIRAVSPIPLDRRTPDDSYVAYRTSWLSPGSRENEKNREVIVTDLEGGSPTSVQSPTGVYPYIISDGNQIRKTNYGGFTEGKLPEPETNQTKVKAEKRDRNDNTKKENLKTLTKEFGLRTTTHGVPRIASSKNWFGRIIWTLICLGSLTGFLLQSSNLIINYLNFEVTNKITIVTEEKLEFPSITVCNTNKLRKSAVANSAYSAMLIVDGDEVLPYYAPCLEGDFPCTNYSLCVKTYLLCDGINHCKDFSDEENCEYGTCGDSQFKCSKGSKYGFCIDSRLQCDRTLDCYDGEDEDDCECKSTEFKCKEKGGCIARSKVCDGIANDCTDGSDEAQCYTDQKTCEGGISCDSSLCVHPAFACDGVADCRDGTDEDISNDYCSLNVEPTTHTCPDDEFPCDTDKCIPSYWICDYALDCDDQTDESSCPYFSSYFGSDGDDESSESSCGFQCGSGECIVSYWYCDGYVDCSDSSDENDCATLGSCSASLTEETGTVSSPNYPDNYPINIECVNSIYVEGKKIKISITALSIEYDDTCSYDYLEIRDDKTSESTGKLCGSTLPEEFTSTSDTVTITFSSDSSEVDSGFSLFYETAGESDYSASASDSPSSDSNNEESDYQYDDYYYASDYDNRRRKRNVPGNTKKRIGTRRKLDVYSLDPVLEKKSNELQFDKIVADQEHISRQKRDLSDCVNGTNDNCTFSQETTINTPSQAPIQNFTNDYSTTKTPTTESGCQDGEFQCNDGLCIHPYKVCDTDENCLNGEDELNCTDQEFRQEDVFSDPNWYTPYLGYTSMRSYFDDFQNNFYLDNGFDRVKGEDPPDWNGFLTFSSTPDFSDLRPVLKLSAEEISQLGHQAEDFILQCSFDQKPCNPLTDFDSFQDDTYGNCFRFNHVKNNSNVKHATRTGQKYGLKLTLFAQQSEFVSIYGQTSGVRVSVNPHDNPVFPSDEGFTIRTGTVTAVSMRENKVQRKSMPYGNCSNSIQEAPYASLIDNPSYKYNRLACEKACVQHKMFETCGCVDTIYLDHPRCELLNKTQDLCRQIIYYFFQADLLGCSNCLQPCSEQWYGLTLSQSLWPSDSYLKHLLRSIHAASGETADINDEESVMKNLASLEIFFEELNYEYVEEQAAYSEYELFSDLGGSLGLYIGLSIITIAEFFEFVIDVIRYLIAKYTGFGFELP